MDRADARVTDRTIAPPASSRTTVALSGVLFWMRLMRLSALGGSSTFAKVVPSTPPDLAGTSIICVTPGRTAVRRPVPASTAMMAGVPEIQRNPAAVVSGGRHSGARLENVARMVTVSATWRNGLAGVTWATRMKQRSASMGSVELHAPSAVSIARQQDQRRIPILVMYPAMLDSVTTAGSGAGAARMPPAGGARGARWDRSPSPAARLP